MATNFVNSEAGVILHTCTASETRSSGDVVLIGDLVTVSMLDIAAAGTGACRYYDTATIAKDTGTPMTVGDSAFWDVADAELNLTSTSNYYAGKIHTAATTAEATVKVILNLGNAGPR